LQERRHSREVTEDGEPCEDTILVRRNFTAVGGDRLPIASHVMDVKEWLGHRHLSTTTRYVHHQPHHEAAERLGRHFTGAASELRRAARCRPLTQVPAVCRAFICRRRDSNPDTRIMIPLAETTQP
jgi:hypothetical protein